MLAPSGKFCGVPERPRCKLRLTDGHFHSSFAGPKKEMLLALFSLCSAVGKNDGSVNEHRCAKADLLVAVMLENIATACTMNRLASAYKSLEGPRLTCSANVGSWFHRSLPSSSIEVFCL